MPFGLNPSLWRGKYRAPKRKKLKALQKEEYAANAAILWPVVHPKPLIDLPMESNVQLKEIDAFDSRGINENISSRLD